MIGALLLVELGSLIAGAVIAVFWKNIVEWLGKAINKIKEVLNVAVEGSEVFIKKVAGRFQEISYHYSKLPGQKWRKDIIINQEYVSESDIPAEILEAARAMENEQIMDITSQVEAQILELKRS